MVQPGSRTPKYRHFIGSHTDCLLHGDPCIRVVFFSRQNHNVFFFKLFYRFSGTTVEIAQNKIRANPDLLCIEQSFVRSDDFIKFLCLNIRTGEDPVQISAC